MIITIYLIIILFFLIFSAGFCIRKRYLNTTPESTELHSLAYHYHDAFANQDEAFTYDAEGIPKRIDYIFTSKEIKTSQAKVLYTPGSDHFPIIVTLTLEPSSGK